VALLGPGGGMSTTFQAAPANDERTLLAGRRRLFMQVFTLLPLLVFAVSSLRAETKFHWTGPIWLAILPVLAATMSRPGLGEGRLDRLLARGWMPLLQALMLIYAYGLFYYPVWGLAGLRAHHDYLEMGWRDLRATGAGDRGAVLRETGRRPAVVGLDKHNTADEMAFYDPRGDGARDTASRHLFFNENAVMYEFWFPRSAFAGRDLIAVSGWRGNVEDPRLPPRPRALARCRCSPPGRAASRSPLTMRGGLWLSPGAAAMMNIKLQRTIDRYLGVPLCAFASLLERLRAWRAATQSAGHHHRGASS
jgi:hypothetical protein